MLPISGTDSPPSERSDGRKSEGEMYRQLSAQLLGKEAGAAGAELSAPYEVPQFPIEQIQSKLARVRVKVSVAMFVAVHRLHLKT